MPVKNPDNYPVPSKGELEALKVLRQHGPSTVRFMHDLLIKDSKVVRYTSTLKMMQLMADKGMVKRDETKTTHVYSAVLEPRFVATPNLNRALSTKRISPSPMGQAIIRIREHRFLSSRLDTPKWASGALLDFEPERRLSSAPQDQLITRLDWFTLNPFRQK